MKAEELMRFDWVHLTDDDTPRQVDWIRSGEVGLFWGQTVTPPYLEPIPLTAEILEKNGWKYNELPFIQGWEQFGLLLYAGGEGYRINCGNNVAMRIDAVHELQHALKLCGIDKEIVL